MGRLSEFDRIRTFFAPLVAGVPAALGLADDAAVLTPPPGRDVVLTKDALVAGVHFLPTDPPDLIARKLVRVNLSDLAAKGAEPLGVLLACAFPPDWDDTAIAAFAAGLGEDCAAFGAPLLGGDTVSTPGPATFSLTALGTVPTGTMIRRSGAQVGDCLAVSGTLGESALGLAVLQGRLAGVSPDEAAALADRYHLPRPRLALGQALRGLVRAGLDISDGLVQDASHLSGVACRIEAEAVPLSPAVRRLVQADPARWWEDILAGGDDYELLVAVAPEHWAEAQARAQALGVPLTAIGHCTASPPGTVVVVDGAGQGLALSRTGYQHR